MVKRNPENEVLFLSRNDIKSRFGIDCIQDSLIWKGWYEDFAGGSMVSLSYGVEQWR